MFSVIIITHNMSDLVGRAIESVLNQTYQDFELIIVDDGSTDDFQSVRHAFQNRNQISFHSVNFLNRGKTREYGISVSKKTYITFLDADDYYHPEYLMTYSILGQQFPEAILISNLRILNNGMEIETDNHTHSFHSNLEYFIKKASPAYAIRRDVATKLRFKYTCTEDIYFLCQAAEQFDIKFTEKPYYVYDQTQYRRKTEIEIIEQYQITNVVIEDLYLMLSFSFAKQFSKRKAKFHLMSYFFYMALENGHKNLGKTIYTSEIPKPYDLMSILRYIKMRYKLFKAKKVSGSFANDEQRKKYNLQ